MSILPKKRDCSKCSNNGIGQDLCGCFEFNQAIDLCQEALTKKIEEVSDIKEITKVIEKQKWKKIDKVISGKIISEIDIDLAQAISKHIKRGMGV